MPALFHSRIKVGPESARPVHGSRASWIHRHYRMVSMSQDKRAERNQPAAPGVDINGKQVAVVGGTGGIGRALSRHLASLGAKVLVVGRTFRDQGTGGISFIEADLRLMREARRVAEEIPAESLDMVIFTTGIFAAPKRQETPEGIELDLAVSYLSRFVILRGIAGRLGCQRPLPSAPPRVFVMGYPGSGQLGMPDDLNAERSYKAMAVHMNTVAGNEALVLDAVRRYPALRTFGLNPGAIKTNIRDNFLGEGSLKSRAVEALIGLLTPSAATYAKRITPVLLAANLDGDNGALFNSKGRQIQPSAGMTPAYVQRFMAASEAVLSATSRQASP